MTSAKKWSLLAAIPLILFSAQGIFLKWKLAEVGCEKLLIRSSDAPTCDQSSCHSKSIFVPNMPYVLLGNIVKAHSLRTVSDGSLVLPTSNATLPGDSSPDLFLYPVVAGREYEVSISYPKTASIRGFSGVRPRQCPNPEAQVAREIASKSTTTAKTMLLILIVVTASAVAATVGLSKRGRKLGESSAYFFYAASVYLLSFWLGDHAFDAFKPSQNVSEFLIRFLGLIGFSIPLMGQIRSNTRLKYLYWLVLLVSCGYAIDKSFVVLYGNTTYYQAIVPILVATSLAVVLWQRDIFGIICLSPTLLDAGKLIGHTIVDYPLIYWNLISFGTYILRMGWELGASQLIPLLWRAGSILQRNAAYQEFISLLDKDQSADLDISDKSIFRKAVENLPRVIGGERIGIALLPTSGQPITLIMDASNRSYRYFEDGKIAGSIFSRVIIYREPLWFETIDSLKKGGFQGLAQNPSLYTAQFFCALPLLYKDVVIGVLSITRLEDSRLTGPLQEEYKQLVRTQVQFVVQKLESYLQKKKLSVMESKVENAAIIGKAIDQAYLSARNEEGFLAEFYKAIGLRTNCAVLSFRKKDQNRATLDGHYNVSAEEEALWIDNPINLDTRIGNRLGPLVVAFTEGKESYVRSFREIKERLHPKSQTILERMGAQSLICVPVKLHDRESAILLVSRNSSEPLNPALIDVIKEFSLTVSVGIRSLRRASQLEAYGRIASRFIDDSSLRNELLLLAEKSELPPTIGRVVENFILIVDMVGSSQLPLSPQIKAELYGRFYNCVADSGMDLLGFQVLKKIGDGVILGGERSFHNVHILENFFKFGEQCEATARQIGSTGVRICLHFGTYFYGLIGTKNSGAIDTIGDTVDQICKFEAVLKSYRDETGISAPVGISAPAAAELLKRGINVFGQAPSANSPIVGGFYLFRDFYLAQKNQITSEECKHLKFFKSKKIA